ncbi:MAG: hypothetical protein Q4P71_06050 [Actinomycetaceae bacterium]|nr:hypothetical protein [Actinomycetaceae bacterium]
MRSSYRYYLLAALLMVYAVVALLTRHHFPDGLRAIAVPSAIIAAGISGVFINRGMNADR